MLRSANRVGRAFSSLGSARSASTLPLIHEVTPRDGLQNEKTVLDVPQKVELVENLIASGFDSIEIASIVRPDLVPAMAKSSELCTVLANESQLYIENKDDLDLAALVPNLRGYELFAEMPILNECVVLTSASDSHSKANVNRSMRDAFKTTCEIIRSAKSDGYKVRAYVSLAFGCPFEGRVDAG